MSILVNGTEMPQRCEECLCRTKDAFGGLGCQATGYIPLRKANQDRPDWCPLVPVPPHGDLIERDALREEVKKHATPSDAWVFSLIRTAPTVIPPDPAEEGET